MIEKLKTLLLALLVFASILLSLGIWSITPQYEAADGPQYASSNTTLDPTYQRTIGSVTWPSQVVLHLGEGKRTALFPGQSGYEEASELLRSASFLDVELSNDYGEEEWRSIVNGPSLQIEFGTTLSNSALEKSELLKFASILEPNMHMRTLYLYGANETNMMRALFYGGPDMRMYTARVMLAKSRVDQLFASQKEAPLYGLYGQSLHRNFYLPQSRLTVPEYVLSVSQDMQMDRLVDSFFIDKSVTRRVIERDGSQIVTDGSRRVRVGARDTRIDYRLLDIEKALGKGFDPDFALVKALGFINEHGGFSGTVQMHEMSSLRSAPDRREYEFRQLIGGDPLLSDLSTKSVQVVGYEVSGMKRSLYGLSPRPYKETNRLSVLSGPELLKKVEQSAWLDRNLVTGIYLAYLVTPPQDQLVTLRPVWVVEQAQDDRKGLFDAQTGERLRSEEGILNGLE